MSSPREKAKALIELASDERTPEKERASATVKAVALSVISTPLVIMYSAAVAAVSECRQSHLACELNRPGFELTPRSWTVSFPPIRRYFSTSNPPG